MAKRKRVLKPVLQRLDEAGASVARWRKAIAKAEADLAKAEACGDEERADAIGQRLARAHAREVAASGRRRAIQEGVPQALRKEARIDAIRRTGRQMMEKPQPETVPPTIEGPNLSDIHGHLAKALDLRGREYRDGLRGADAREQTGTVHRLAKAGVLEVSDGRLTRIKQTPIEVLSARSVLSERQAEAAKRLLEDWHLAGLSPVGSIDWNRTGGGAGGWSPGFMPVQEAQANARANWRAAIRALGRSMSYIVVSVVIEGEKTDEKLESIAKRLTGRAQADQARASLIDTLKIGLDMLAAHYKIPDVAKRVRGWRDEKSVVREDLWGPVQEALAHNCET